MVIFLLAYFVGCVSVKQYPGPELPNDQIARIIGDEGIRVMGINKAIWFQGPREIHILPGFYRFRVSLGGLGAPASGKSITLNLIAEAGHVYQFKKQIDTINKRWGAWIIDTETNKTVSN
jgi:hypothetical protein